MNICEYRVRFHYKIANATTGQFPLSTPYISPQSTQTLMRHILIPHRIRSVQSSSLATLKSVTISTSCRSDFKLHRNQPLSKLKCGYTKPTSFHWQCKTGTQRVKSQWIGRGGKQQVNAQDRKLRGEKEKVTEENVRRIDQDYIDKDRRNIMIGQKEQHYPFFTPSMMIQRIYRQLYELFFDGCVPRSTANFIRVGHTIQSEYHSNSPQSCYSPCHHTPLLCSPTRLPNTFNEVTSNEPISSLSLTALPYNPHLSAKLNESDPFCSSNSYDEDHATYTDFDSAAAEAALAVTATAVTDGYDNSDSNENNNNNDIQALEKSDTTLTKTKKQGLRKEDDVMTNTGSYDNNIDSSSADVSVSIGNSVSDDINSNCDNVSTMNKDNVPCSTFSSTPDFATSPLIIHNWMHFSSPFIPFLLQSLKHNFEDTFRLCSTSLAVAARVLIVCPFLVFYRLFWIPIPSAVTGISGSDSTWKMTEMFTLGLILQSVRFATFSILLLLRNPQRVLGSMILRMRTLGAVLAPFMLDLEDTEEFEKSKPRYRRGCHACDNYEKADCLDAGHQSPERLHPKGDVDRSAKREEKGREKGRAMESGGTDRRENQGLGGEGDEIGGRKLCTLHHFTSPETRLSAALFPFVFSLPSLPSLPPPPLLPPSLLPPYPSRSLWNPSPFESASFEFAPLELPRSLAPRAVSARPARRREGGRTRVSIPRKRLHSTSGGGRARRGIWSGESARRRNDDPFPGLVLAWRLGFWDNGDELGE